MYPNYGKTLSMSMAKFPSNLTLQRAIAPQMTTSPPSSSSSASSAEDLQRAYGVLANYIVKPSGSPNNNLATLVGIWATAHKAESLNKGIPPQLTAGTEAVIYADALSANSNAKIVHILKELRNLSERSGATITGGLIRNNVAKRYWDNYESKNIWDVLIENGTSSSSSSNFMPPDGSGYQPPHQQPNWNRGTSASPSVNSGKGTTPWIPIILIGGVSIYLLKQSGILK